MQKTDLENGPTSDEARGKVAGWLAFALLLQLPWETSASTYIPFSNRKNGPRVYVCVRGCECECVCVTAASALGAQCGIYHLCTSPERTETQKVTSLMIQRCLIDGRAE